MAFPTGWTKKHTITIDNTKVSGSSDLTDFPVLLADDNFLDDCYTNARSDGGDIRFSSDVAGSTQLAAEVVNWDQSGTTSEVWVKIPTLSHDEDTVLYVWYGKSDETMLAETDTYGAQNVWKSSYRAVYHMNEDPSGSAPQIKDSTSNNKDGSSLGSMTTADLVTGKIGKSIDFDGNDDRIDLPIMGSSFTNHTVSLWVNPDVAGVQKTAVSADAGGYSDDIQIGIGAESGGYVSTNRYGATYHRSSGSTRYAIQDTADITTGSWQYFSLSYNGSVISLYRNGSSVATTNAGGLSIGNTDKWFIGANFSIRLWDGKLDEVHISTTALSADWIATEYNNQNSPSTFATASGGSSGGIYPIIINYT